MQGSPCSHRGAARFRRSFDHDSLASIGSKTLSGDSGLAPMEGVGRGGVAGASPFWLGCLDGGGGVAVEFFVGCDGGEALMIWPVLASDLAVVVFGLKNPWRVF